MFWGKCSYLISRLQSHARKVMIINSLLAWQQCDRLHRLILSEKEYLHMCANITMARKSPNQLDKFSSHFLWTSRTMQFDTSNLSLSVDCNKSKNSINLTPYSKNTFQGYFNFLKQISLQSFNQMYILAKDFNIKVYVPSPVLLSKNRTRGLHTDGRQLWQSSIIDTESWESLVQYDKLSPLERIIHEKHLTAVKAGKLFYTDPTTGYQVMTRLVHMNRGRCCGNACRHCPYGHANVDPARKVQMRFNSAFYT
ncbi:hypothetical protein CHS0354_021915 [Potamilus streckersoni]|uniref:Uncharacterized protein n=1 Tax=Potamilus streckersoni TaxID=2493646 RepID=A0AAE0SKE6_9BIVA|nr:hypothetical protein CHS0354_021915 [Potamilus streckersoni]